MSKSILAEKYLGWLPDHWERCQLGDLCLKILDGVHQTPTYVEEGIPFLRVTDLQNSLIDLSKVKRISKEEFEEITKNNKPEKGDILLSKNGTIGLSKVIDWDWDFATFVSLALLKLPKRNCKIRADFLCRLFESEVIWQQIRNYSKTGTVTNLHLEEIRKLWVPLPPKPEQDRIAAILGTWDEAIAKTQALIERKEEEALIISTKLINRVAHESKLEKLGHVFERVTRKNTVGNKNVLTISGQHGLINQEEFFNKSVASKDLSNYYLLHQGEFAYNKSYSKGYPMGAIKRLDAYEAGVVSVLYICFKLREGYEELNDFYAHFFELGGLNRGISGIAQEGARNHGLLNIGVSDFFDLEIPLPSPEHACKAADVMNTCQEEIAILNRQLEAIQKQKKGLMQKLLTGEWPVAAAQAPQLQEAAG